jgi:ketosteroid isomerase-like protein
MHARAGELVVADRLAIRELIDRFSDAVNQRDFRHLQELFASDAVWEVTPPIGLRFEGAAKIADGIEWSISRQQVLVQISSGIVIELKSPQCATARSTVVEFGRPKETGVGMHSAGTYCDELAREHGEWRFQRRTLRVRYVDEVALPGQIFESDSLSRAEH